MKLALLCLQPHIGAWLNMLNWLFRNSLFSQCCQRPEFGDYPLLFGALPLEMSIFLKFPSGTN